MTGQPRTQESFTSMREVRDGIDRIDREIVALLGERFRHIEAAARIKQDIEAIRDEPRIEEVVTNVRQAAVEQGVPAELAAALYRQLVEASVAYEMDRFIREASSA